MNSAIPFTRTEQQLQLAIGTNGVAPCSTMIQLCLQVAKTNMAVDEGVTPAPAAPAKELELVESDQRPPS